MKFNGMSVMYCYEKSIRKFYFKKPLIHVGLMGDILV